MSAFFENKPSAAERTMRHSEMMVSTTQAITTLIHNRMPLILDGADGAKWLGGEPANEQELLALLRPCLDEWLKIWPVDNRVGNLCNAGAELVLPLETI
jgi:putative SOS response-associated peptidase YedK